MMATLPRPCHHGGHVNYTSKHITVTLDRPDSPRVALSPRAPHRRTQRHTSDHARRPPPPDLQDQHGMSLNSDLAATSGGLSLYRQLHALPWPEVPASDWAQDKAHGRRESRTVQVVSVSPGCASRH